MAYMAYLVYISNSGEKRKMIGNPKWFTRRKYGGWGIHPKTWQGWIYLIAIILPLIVFQSIPIWDNMTRIVVTVIWIVLIFIDVIHIMFNLDKDELEERIEAISERNAAWTMSFILALGIVYQVTISAINKEFMIDYFLIAALIFGLGAKAFSNIYYERKGLK